ncbi:MAG: hypothetical protein PHX18_00150 [Candidatus Gastranaerophilales bacterium]|nr:hypothetical protein [Candidatus Gastranaerophilales bacterium]
MNLLEIMNKTLVELNYKEITDFDIDIKKPDNKRLLDVINRLNKDICILSDDFYFRQKVKEIELTNDRFEYSPNISGHISKIIAGTQEYKFESDYSLFYKNTAPAYSFGSFGTKLLIAPTNAVAKVFYITDLFVEDATGELKSDFKEADDKSIIPENFVEKLFINGAAFNFKQNTTHPKYNHWKMNFDSSVGKLTGNAKLFAGNHIIINGGFKKL